MGFNMKIFYVIANARYGGMPEHVLMMSRELSRRGHDVQVLSMSTGPMLAEFEKAGIRISTVPFLGDVMRRRPLLAKKAIDFTRRLIGEAGPDIVHTHGPRANIITARALRLNDKIPLVATAHGSFRQFMAGNASAFGRLQRWLKRSQYLWVDRYTGRVVERFIAVSEATRDDLIDFIGVPVEKVRVILNGVADLRVSDEDKLLVRKELGLSESHKLVTYVGRVAYHKGAVDLVDAAGSIVRNIPAARLLIVGDGPLVDKLKKRVARCGFADRIIFTGDRRDSIRIIAASDLFVLPSFSEGLALTLLEAAMTGTAMVATDVGGNSEVVYPDETGLLVPVNSPADLSRAIVELLDDHDGRIRMGNAARRLWQEKFTAPLMVEKTEALYQELSTDR